MFGFLPGNGIHDIHMNQGNSRRFQGDDGVRQDGGILIHFPGQERWVGIFLAFQSQSWHTDDITGHALEDVDGARPESGSRPVRIVAALVNPKGPAPEAETVTLLNASPESVDLTGWTIGDRLGQKSPVPAVPLDAGAALAVTLTGGAQLGNQGGEITLFDITREPGRQLAFGLGVHGCPGAQLAREQLRLTLRELTERLPGLRLAEDEPVIMRPTMIHRSPYRLRLTW